MNGLSRKEQEILDSAVFDYEAELIDREAFDAVIVGLLEARVALDQQVMWDALGILGFDQDGDPTPAAQLTDGGKSFRKWFLSKIREHRADYDDAVDSIPS